MRKIGSFILVLTGFFLVSCQSASPDKFFERVLLNTNQISDVAPDVFGKRLDSESTAGGGNGGQAKQIVDFKIVVIEKAIGDIKELNVTDEDAKVIKEKTVELFETVLPVYKIDYTSYAKLCDTKGTEEEKQAILQKIQNDDMPKIDALFNEVFTLGKSYADKHQLNVSWGR